MKPVKLIALLIFGAALFVTAALTRPNLQHFETSMQNRIALRGESPFYQNILKSRLANDLKRCTYKNHILWADLERDGKVIYSGFLGHWLERNIVRIFS